MSYLTEQGAYFRALGHGALGMLRCRYARRAVRDEVAPPSANLVRAYLRHLGAPPERYRDRLPAHLFAQWSYAVVARALAGAPYPLHRILTAGCRLEQRAPLPREGIRLEAQAEEPAREGCCIELGVRVQSGTRAIPDALDARLLLSVPGGDGTPAPPVCVPLDARAIATWDLDAAGAREFALLSGDLNPLHWLPVYARRAGFEGTVAHGLSLLARTAEALSDAHDGDPDAWRVLDVRFPRALVLPARVSLFVHESAVYVGERGGPACLAGSYAR